MAPLDGITVLDFSTLLPGPLAGLILAEAGARVIKVERAGQGDELRLWPPTRDGDAVNFALLNRGKESLELDLKSPADRARLEPWLDGADVLIEQFRPGVMARLGLEYETLSQSHPRLIYCSITGYGQDGPEAQTAGHDLNYLAASGLLSLSMGPAEAPVMPPALVADIAGGAYPAVMNILLALQARHRTGRGAYLDIAMTENLLPLAWWALGEREASGTCPGNGDRLLSGGTARYGLFPARDGRVVAVAAIEDRFWRNFCDVIALPADLRDDARDPAATRQAVARRIAQRDGADWARDFAGRDCCCNMVDDLERALAAPQVRARGIGRARTRLPGGGTVTALPTPLTPSLRPDPQEVRSAPALGQMSDEDD